MGYPITKNGHELLKKELEELKERRSAAIREAANEKQEVHITRSAGYELANQELQRITQRIDLLKPVVENADIIDPDTMPRNGKCLLGTYVQLKKEDGSRLSFQIVKSLEVQLRAEGALCSTSTDLGKKIIGKKEGDVFAAYVGDEEQEYKVMAVRYEEIKEIIPEQVAEELVEEIEVPEPQPAPIPPVAVTAEKTAEPEETITEETPAPVAPVGEVPAPSAPQEKTTFWSAALAWVKKFFK